MDYAWQTVAYLKDMYQLKELSLRDWEKALAEAEQNRIYERIPPGKPYGDLDAMLQAEIGKTRAESVRDVDLRSHGGDRKSPQAQQDQGRNTTLIGRGAPYELARLKRDCPDLHTRVLAGEMSAHAAAIAAGFRHRTIAVRPNVQSMMRAIHEYLSPSKSTRYRTIDALRAHVAEWDAWVGDTPADAASRAQVANAARALADLMKAMANHEREGGVRELVRQITDFLSRYQAHAYLDGLRGRLQREKEVLGQQAHGIQQLGLSHTTTAAQVDQRVWEIAEDLDILDALVALHEMRQRREKERTQPSERRRKEQDQEQAAAEQGPAMEREPGWEF